jgi:cytidylate kinase
MIIAIDGPAAAGKGTLARRLAQHLNLAMLDTGLLYRGTGWGVLKAGGDPADPVAATKAAQALEPADLNDSTLRSEECGSAASKVAAIPAVREALLEWQRRFAHKPPKGFAGAVLDGRDIGTKVCPDADVKLFITANVEERAKRRLKELQEKGSEAIYARVLQDMKERDDRDSNRGVAPLVPAADALIIDTGSLDAEQVFKLALDYISSRNRSG